MRANTGYWGHSGPLEGIIDGILTAPRGFSAITQYSPLSSGAIIDIFSSAKLPVYCDCTLEDIVSGLPSFTQVVCDPGCDLHL